MKEKHCIDSFGILFNQDFKIHLPLERPFFVLLMLLCKFSFGLQSLILVLLT